MANSKQKPKIIIKTKKQGTKNSSHIYKKELLKALEDCFGNVSQACKKVKIDRTTHYQYCRTDEAYKLAVEDIQEMAVDYVESKLMKQISLDKETSIIFYLKTKARHRGYSQDVVINNNIKPLEVKFV